MTWFTLRVLPGHDARIAATIRERTRAMESVREVLVPLKKLKLRAWRGPGTTMWAKRRPGFVFIDVDAEGGFPREVLEVLEGVPGVGAIDSYKGEPRPTGAEVAGALDRGWWPFSGTVQHGGIKQRSQRRMNLAFGPGRRHRLD